jgi:hypothetical protein
MKKLILTIICLSLLACKKENPVSNVDNCSKVADAYTAALTAWSTDINNKTKCEAVRKSLNDILNACTLYTAAQRKTYQDEVAKFTCN